MDFQRQTDIFDPHKAGLHAAVTIIGLGAIGSPTALALAKLGVSELTLIDNDVVSAHNVPNQLFPAVGCEGKPKVEVITDFLNTMADGLTLTGVHANFEANGKGKNRLAGIVVSGVDSMTSRQIIWKAVRYNAAVPLFIDGRLGGELIRLYAVRPSMPDDIARYEKTLYASKDAVDLPCGARAIIYSSLAIAALISRSVAKFLTSDTVEFETLFHLGTMQLEQVK